MSLTRRLEPLLDRIGGEADATDAAGHLDPVMARLLAESGAFTATVPASIGGSEEPAPEMARAIESVAARHGSTGWCVMIGATTALLSAWLPEPTARRIWGADPLVVTGGAYAPTGRAVDLGDGSYSVSGRWEWGSGSQHCSWLLGGAMVVDRDGSLVLDDAGRPHPRLCFAPAAEVEIVPNWDVLGMRGTGSHDLVMHEVTVPAEHTVSLLADRPWAPGPLYRFPPFGMLALGVAAVSLGVARSAMEAIVELASAKTPSGARRPLGQRSTVRAEVARCEAELRAARALYHAELDAAWVRAEAQGEPGGADAFDASARVSLRLAATHAATVAADVCVRVHRLGGGTSVRHGQVLERTLRDALTATQHIMVGPQLYEAVGGVLMGDEPGFAEL